MVRTPRRWAQPKIPIERRGHCGGILRALDPLRPPQGRLAAMRRAIRPYMHFADRANRAISEPFVYLPIAFEGHSLVAHLRSDLGGPRHSCDRARFINRPGERLFTIDMLAHF